MAVVLEADVVAIVVAEGDVAVLVVVLHVELGVVIVLAAVAGDAVVVGAQEVARMSLALELDDVAAVVVELPVGGVALRGAGGDVAVVISRDVAIGDVGVQAHVMAIVGREGVVQIVGGDGVGVGRALVSHVEKMWMRAGRL